MIALKFEGLKDLNRKPANQTSWHALEVVLLYKFIEVHAQTFKWKEQMLSEDCVVKDPYDIVFIILIFWLEVSQKLQLDSGLMLEALLVSDDFNRNYLFIFMVKTLESLSETTRAKLV